MIKNLLLVAIRNFKKDKWYSLLNILRLIIGITYSLFLIFYITDELSYDRYHEKADRIFRIDSYIQEKDKNTNWAITQMRLGPTAFSILTIIITCLGLLGLTAFTTQQRQ